jgi:hypothetical protein
MVVMVMATARVMAMSRVQMVDAFCGAAVIQLWDLAKVQVCLVSRIVLGVK